jgi:hypothetical protein
MTVKSNFEKLVQQPMPAPTRADGADGHDPARVDGRSKRRTGRTVKYGTIVSEEFRDWIKARAEMTGKSQAALLDDMRAAYSEKHGA